MLSFYQGFKLLQSNGLKILGIFLLCLGIVISLFVVSGGVIWYFIWLGRLIFHY